MEENNTIEQYNNALFYLEQGYTQNIDKAIELLILAGEKGNADAQYVLGLAYYDGEGVEQSHSKAVYWLQKACENGFEEACEFLNKIKK